MGRRRILILGGGMAGLSAAWALSRDGWQREFSSITLMERSHHLGGKAGSVRGPNGRIEEHGLHVWLGYYDNAFALMRDCYRELDRQRTDPGCPVLDWQGAFTRSESIGVADHGPEGWEHWIASFGTNALLPGEPDARGITPERFVDRSLQLLWDLLLSVDGGGHVPSTLSTSATAPAPIRRRGDLARAARRLELAALAATARLASLLADGAAAVLGADARLLHAVVSELRGLQTDIDRRLVSRLDGRRIGVVVDLVVTAVRGVVTDGLMFAGEGFAAADDEDFRAWLTRHGARQATTESGIVRGMYDLVFAYEGGDPTRPRFAAGQGLELAARFFFDYKGSIFWKMTAGMGDVVIAPLYQALRRRGVRIELGCDVERIELAADHAAVAAVHVSSTEDRDRALVGYGGLPCFVDPPGAGPRTRRSLRAGEDFDVVVLATSIGAVPAIAPDLLAHERWTNTVARVGTVATHAAQVWLASGEGELGPMTGGLTSSGWGPPFDTCASMSHLLPMERWPAPGPRGLLYLCGVLDDLEVRTGMAGENVGRDLERYLSDGARRLAPHLRDGDVVDRFTVAATDPSDRYVQSLPGTRADRLGVGDSGVAGLVLAGDWTRTGLDAGCIEAAVISGVQAANVVMGRPVGDTVLGGWTAPAMEEAHRVSSPRDQGEDWLGAYRPFEAFERFAEAQRMGLDAASSLMGRFAEMFAPPSGDGDRPEATFGASPHAGSDVGDGQWRLDDDGVRAMRAEAARSMDTVLEMARRLFESTLDMADAAMSRPDVAAWMADEPGPHDLELRVSPGSSASASVWLHHREPTTASKVSFSVTPLRDARGVEPAATVDFDPRVLLDVAPSETRSTTIHVDVDIDCPLGTYLGLVLADGADHLALTLRLVVAATDR